MECKHGGRGCIPVSRPLKQPWPPRNPQRLADPSGASLIGRDMDASDLERKRWREDKPTIRSLKNADVIRETTRIVVIAKILGRRSSLQHVYLPAPEETMDALYDRVLSDASNHSSMTIAASGS